MGWVVGNAGLGGAFAILGLGILITTCTGLSLSSIATNTRIGAGGPYAIMNRSLGLEVGGSIGVPLFLTRPLGVAMYIIGFREGLLWIFPDLMPLAVDLGVFAVLFGIAYVGADLAFKTQYVIMAIIVASLISIFASSKPIDDPVAIQWWGSYPGDPDTGFSGATFWSVFAVFFPATTGILAGANMSGDLKDPRRAIPHGTIAAIVISSIIYFAVATWCAVTGSLQELAGNYNHIIDNAAFPPLVTAGLLGATASSALAGLVGGPRLLLAMGDNHIIPFSEQMAKTKGGEPRNAILVTGVLTLVALMIRDLNAIAPLVTMFFLITYCMINVVVLLEGGLGLVSYRPTLQVPLLVPALGLAGCMFSMFIVNPTFSLVSVTMVMSIYAWMRRRGVADVAAQKAAPGEDVSDGDDVRSSVFVALAEWAAANVTPEDSDNARAWKPHFLVPVEDARELRGAYHVLLDVARPEGTVKLMGVATRRPGDRLLTQLEATGRALRDDGVLASWSLIDLGDYPVAVKAGAMALHGAFFRPNVFFLRLVSEAERRAELRTVLEQAVSTRMGVLLFGLHPKAGLGRLEHIRMFVRSGPGSWDPDQAFGSGNLNLNLLMGYRMWRVWQGRLTLSTVVRDEADIEHARGFLRELRELARLPDDVCLEVMHGEFILELETAPQADLTIFGLQRGEPNLDWADRMVEVSGGSCLFVHDSGMESARA